MITGGLSDSPPRLIILLQADYKAHSAMQTNSSEKMRLREAHEHAKHLKKTIKGLENDEKVSAAAMNCAIKKKEIEKINLKYTMNEISALESKVGTPAKKQKTEGNDQTNGAESSLMYS